MKYVDLDKTYKCTAKKLDLNNSKSVLCDISIKLSFDCCYQDDELDQEFKDQLKRGDLAPHVLQVTASYEGIEESDYLGGILLDAPITVDKLYQDWAVEYDMESQAMESLKTKLNDLISNQINVILDCKKVLSQYGQWNGYLKGVGHGIAKFFDNRLLDLDMLKQKFRSYVLLSTDCDGLWEAYDNIKENEERDTFQKLFPLVSRDTTYNCFNIIYNATSPMIALNNEACPYDCDCEYRYDVNLDDMTVAIFTNHLGSHTTKQKAKPIAILDIYSSFNRCNLEYDMNKLDALIDLNDLLPKYKNKNELKKAINDLTDEHFLDCEYDKDIKDQALKAAELYLFKAPAKKKAVKKKA